MLTPILPHSFQSAEALRWASGTTSLRMKRAKSSAVGDSPVATDPRFRFERDGNTENWDLILLANQAVSVGDFSLGYTATDGVNPTSGTISLEAVETPVTFTAPATRTIPLNENNAANLAVANMTATSSDADGAVHIQSFALVDANGDAVTGGI